PRVAGAPRIEPQRRDQPLPDTLEFSAVFEVYPEIHVGDVAQIAIVRPVAEVTAQDVERTLDVLRGQRMTFTPVERAAQAGDRIRVDFTGTIDGVEFPGGQAKNFPIVIGEARMLPEFEAAATGMKA